MENITEYLQNLPMNFILGFFVGYTFRVLVGRFKAVKYSIENLFRFFK